MAFEVGTSEMTAFGKVLQADKNKLSCFRIRKRDAYTIGDRVRFTPSERTRGHYQDLERFGLRPGEVVTVREIRDNTYLYFEGGAGGWPWNEFTRVE